MACEVTENLCDQSCASQRASGPQYCCTSSQALDQRLAMLPVIVHSLQLPVGILCCVAVACPVRSAGV